MLFYIATEADMLKGVGHPDVLIGCDCFPFTDPKTGKLPPVGNTVDIKEATYTNDIGDSQLTGEWTDPDFDPTVSTAYYVRVLEIPTPRWSTYDAKTLGIDPPAGYPATQQERAWSSPIWYTPDPTIAAKAKYEAVVHGAAKPGHKK